MTDGRDDPTAGESSTRAARFVAITAAFAAAALGYSLAAGLGRAATSASFIILPEVREVAWCVAMVLGFSLLSLALVETMPRVASLLDAVVAKRRDRLWRAWGRDRTREEFAQVERGILTSSCVLAAVAAYLVVPLSVLTVLLAVAAITLNAWAIATICRSLSFDPVLGAAVGFPYGMAAGWFLT